ncbi:MAG: four helix bundle protein [Patescibacteria group bacterium]|nr:four helix bundle protein [Patescibacteria group bacterium]
MSKDKVQISNEAQSPKSQKTDKSQYNLEERTAKFGEDVIKFLGSLPKNTVNNVLVSQLVRSATSVGANYMEADGAESKKDFKHKIAISKKEAKEGRHWLRMVSTANSQLAPACRQLWQEATELSLIFSAIIRKLSS